MVRPVQDDRACARGDRRLAWQQGQDRQAQRRREPGYRIEIWNHVDPDLDGVQERQGSLAPGWRRTEAKARTVDHHRGGVTFTAAAFRSMPALRRRDRVSR